MEFGVRLWSYHHAEASVAAGAGVAAVWRDQHLD